MTKARDLANIISGGFDATDIPNLDTAKITSGTLADARIPNLATSKITSGTFVDARLPATALNSNVDLTNLSASNLTSGTVATARLGSGTADATTFLRGDNTFAEAGGTMTPAFFAEKNATQSPGNNAFTKITYETEVVDTNNAFASSRFTVPSGKAGKYFIGFNKMNNKGTLTAEDYTMIYKNGSSFENFPSFSGNQTQLRNHNIIMDLAVGDYIEIYHYGTTTNSSSGSLLAGERNSFYGYKIIE